MGRILLSNRANWIKGLHKRYITSGFTLNYGNGFVKVYDKLNVHTNNYYISKDGAVVASNGTFSYKNLIGDIALRSLYEDFVSNGERIDIIRRDCFGSYFVTIIRNDEMIAFVDETGTYAIYYYHDIQGNYLITNTYYHVASETGRSVNLLANVEEQLEFCLIDNETPFQNVYRLMGNEVIIINRNHFKVEKVKCNYFHLESSDFEMVAKEIKDAIVLYTAKMNLFPGKPILFMTGGVDSRLSLASYLAASMSPTLCSWGGNNIKMNTKDEDAVVSKSIAVAEKLKYKYVDVSEEDPYSVTDISREQFEKYGEWATIYGNNKKWFNIFESKDECIYEFGYFGETIKGWELLDRIGNKYLTEDEFCRIYTGRQSYHFAPQSTIDLEDYRERVHKKIKRLIENLGMNSQALSKEDCMVLYYKYRLHADTKCCNFANIFGFCSPVLAHKAVADLINQCSYDYKQHDRINLYITKLIDECLLDVQYFTHSKYMQLDKKSLTLSYLKTDIRKQKLIDITQKLHIHSFLKKLKRKLKNNNSVQAQMLIQYANSINMYPYMLDSGIVIDEKSFDYPPMAISMLAQCQMIDNAINHDTKN